MKTEEKELGFDELYLSTPTSAGELQKMRADNTLLISTEVENFCRAIVWHGMIPTLAYEVAFAKEVVENIDGVESRVWVKPDHASYAASRLLRRKEVADRIREMRDEVLIAGGVDREQVMLAMKSLMLDSNTKTSDRIAAAALLGRMEGFNKETEVAAGGTLVIQLPFAPNQLLTAPPMKLVEGIVLDN